MLECFLNEQEENIHLAIYSSLLNHLFLQLIFSIPEKSLTCDEIAHLSAGYSYLKTGDYRINKEHPPLVKLLAGIPILFLKAKIPLEHYSWREGQEWLFGDESFFRYIFFFVFSSFGKANLKLIIHFFCHFSGLFLSQF